MFFLLLIYNTCIILLINYLFCFFFFIAHIPQGKHKDSKTRMPHECISIQDAVQEKKKQLSEISNQASTRLTELNKTLAVVQHSELFLKQVCSNPFYYFFFFFYFQ